jgi:thiosulfate reductase cytochrome b subunit
MSRRTATSPPKIDYRHPWPVRLWHWTNALACIALLVTGALIFDIHPHLYWGDDGHEGMPAFLSLTSTGMSGTVPRTDLQIGSRHWDTTGILGKVLDDGDSGQYLLAFGAPDDWQFGATRGWHFLFAWVLGLSVPLYGSYLLWSRRLRAVWLPSRSELGLRSLASDLWQHLRLRRRRGEASRRYNVLQKLTYLAVLGLLMPLIVLTGFAMSNAMTAAFPHLLTVFGGRHSARSLHFLAALLMALFIVVHVLQVFVGGFSNLMRSMITGRYAVEPGDFR